MSNIFFTSDWHLFHEKTFSTFKKVDGSPLRNFSNVDEMNEFIIDSHNKVVKPNDKVYFLGDAVFHKKYLYIIDRFNGDKVLIKGNHDLLDAKDYLQYFRDIRGTHQVKGLLMSHIPIHPESLGRWGFNVHGHLHANVITHNGRPDPRYINVSVENINYTPISLEEIRERTKNSLES